MASRRKLKKTIQFVSSELISDVYFRCLMSKNIDADKVEKLVTDIVNLSKEYILRVNRPDGKETPKLVKKYFANLFAGWQVSMEKVLKEIESI